MRLLIFLLENIGVEQRVEKIRIAIWGNRIDGGPSDENFRVVLSRVRRAIYTNKLPFRIDTNRSVTGTSSLEGTLTLYRVKPHGS